MGRIIKEIEIKGRPAKALFGSGAVNSYVLSPLVAKSPRRAAKPLSRVALGRRSIDIRDVCLVEGKIEGQEF